LVRRGLKPTIFEIYVNGELIKKDAAPRAYQAHLENNILQVKYDPFTQVVILGNASYTPFMQLTTGARREFIEFILDIGVFSVMNGLLKDRITTVKSLVQKISTDTILATEQIILTEGFIQKLEQAQKKQSEDVQAKIDEGTAEIDRLMEEIAALAAQIAENDTQDKFLLSGSGLG
jgi:DNA repair exonuclease SbcCD ATPase subunit